jgi:glycosyltransferase involved in cell wall biosynthesis
VVKIKICIVSPIYPVASKPQLGKFIHGHSKELAKQGKDVTLITIGDKKDKDYEVIDNIKVYRVKEKSRLLFGIRIFALILKLNKKHRFDILHSHFVGPLTVICGIASKLIKVPYVVTARGVGLLPKSFIKKIYLFFPQKITCVSNYTASLAREYVDGKKVISIPNGLDVERLKPTKNANKFKKELKIKNKKVLLSICNLVERKGLDLIIKTLPTVMKEEPNIVYFIIGQGPEKEKLISLANKLNLKDKVAFIDYVSDADLANYFNICDIFLLMSKTIEEKSAIEGFGNVYLEASFMGKPVIGGKSGGTSDAVVDGKTGFLIEPDDAEELKKKIILLLKNKTLREKMGRYGRKRVLNGFLWKHNVEKLVKVYSGLLN